MGEFGAPQRAAAAIMSEIRTFAPRVSADDYVVDIALQTSGTAWSATEAPGVTPGPVGRHQRRFIVWHTLPTGLDTADRVRDWFVAHLPETERLVREYLPTKSKRYPAAELADEIRALRSHLMKER
jgi:hypothetical protein